MSAHYGAQMETMQLVRAICDVVCREGHFDYPVSECGKAMKAASVCGLTAFFDGGNVARITARGLDIVLEYTSFGTVSPAGAVGVNAVQPMVRFYSGNADALQRWYDQLSHLHSVIGGRYPARAETLARAA